MKDKYKKLLDYIVRSKKDYGLRIVDAHVHPYDVLGEVSVSSHKNYDDKKTDFYSFKPTLSEFFYYGNIYKVLVRGITNYRSIYIQEYLNKIFNNVSQDFFLKLMATCQIDTAVLIPLEPSITTRLIHNNFDNKAFLKLGSIDVHGININDIDDFISKQVTDFNIVGIKLHPNLQQFHPIPSRNQTDIAEKLDVVYKAIKKNNLFLLTHTGRTNFLNGQNKKQYSLFQNFFENGIIPIIETYGVKTVFAHLSNYAELRYDYSLIKRSISRYDKSIFFDTSACSPPGIYKFMCNFGTKNLIYGSDALYNDPGYSLLFCTEAIQRYSKMSNIDHNLELVLGKNFYDLIQ